MDRSTMSTTKYQVICVETHSPAMDAGLIRTLSANGWKVVDIRPWYRPRDPVGRALHGMDGEQAWLNTRFL